MDRSMYENNKGNLQIEMGYFQTVLQNAWKHLQKDLSMPRKAVIFPLLHKVPGMVWAHSDIAWSPTQQAPVWIGNKLKNQAWFTELRPRSWSEPSHCLGQSEICLRALDLSWACLGWRKSYFLFFWAKWGGDLTFKQHSSAAASTWKIRDILL